MKQTRFGTVAALLILLLSLVSCKLFESHADGPKPTQIVDLPSFIGKSRDEITKMVGSTPSKLSDTETDWELLEGTLSIRKEKGKPDNITYLIRKPYYGFATPPEMAALVNIDVKPRKVNEGRGWRSYDDISVSGKTFDLALDNWDGRYPLARMTNIRMGGEVPLGFKPTKVVDLPAMIGTPRAEITKLVGTPPYKEENIAADWQLPEGRLTYFDGLQKPSIYYKLNSYSDFDPSRGVASPEEMATLVHIDLQGRQPEIQKENLFYGDLSSNGRTFDLYISFDPSDKRYLGVSIANFK